MIDVELQNITKTYEKGKVKAVTNVSFSVEKGELFGLIGPDGAGKTTLFRILTTLLIADHGNCETMINPDGSPNTAHTTNPVPVILIDKELKHIDDGVLGDIAPTILKLMGIKQPKAMTRHALI